MATATERQELESLKVKVAQQRAGKAETGSTLGSLQVGASQTAGIPGE